MTVTVRNTDTHRRVWPRLRRADTGTTLELDPGGEAEVEEMPEGDVAFLAVRKSKAVKADLTD